MSRQSNATAQKIPLDEIQGLIVRGYNMQFVRHLTLEIIDHEEFKQSLLKMPITSAAPWPVEEGKKVRPETAVNISFTWRGLQALQIPAINNEAFHSFDAFRAGAANRAYYIGDRDDSSPGHWKPGFSEDQMHVLISIYSYTDAALERKTNELIHILSNSVKEHNRLDGENMPKGKIHFGYRDGISQPNVAGFPAKRKDGGQLAVPAWNFVLKDDDYQLDYDGNPKLPPQSQPPSPLHTEGAAPYQLPVPRELGLWGSFAAFRVLQQDVVAFDSFLQSYKDKIDPELLAAKLCGRWRSGTPLALAPEQDIPIPESELNNFNYKVPEAGALGAQDDPHTVNDLLGLRCPIGAHMRRNNPRRSPVSSDVNLHRIIRRGIPYGPAYDPNKGDDGVERGLLGLFICASLESQFEFLMHNWVNDHQFAPDLMGLDPLLGANHKEDSTFTIASGATKQDQTEVTGFSRFINTRGSAYVFFPSLSALHFLATS